MSIWPLSIFTSILETVDRKMRCSITLLSLIFVFLPLAADSSAELWEPFEKDGMWGFKDRDGQVVIDPQFILVSDFTAGGIAAVLDEEGWVYIDTDGREIIRPYIFDNEPDDFRQGLARFVSEHKFGYFDIRGAIAVSPRFDFAAPFFEDRAAVCRGGRMIKAGEHGFWKGGTWGFIDKAGNLVIPYQYDRVHSFENGAADVMHDGKWSVIDRWGKPAPNGEQEAGQPGQAPPDGGTGIRPDTLKQRAPVTPRNGYR